MTGRRWPAGVLIDGLVLSGGADVDPARYGRERVPECGTVEAERDAWEVALVDVALTEGIPIFGICRGIQVLNVARGGTLVQHLAADAGDGHLRVDVARDAAVHAVKLDPGSLAAAVYGIPRCSGPNRTPGSCGSSRGPRSRGSRRKARPFPPAD